MYFFLFPALSEASHNIYFVTVKKNEELKEHLHLNIIKLFLYTHFLNSTSVFFCILCYVTDQSSPYIHLSFDDGFRRLHPTDILVHCEYSFHFRWDNFKHVGHSQFFEVFTTTKEIMLFHDLGVVVFRYRGGYNKSSVTCGLSGRLVD